MPVIPTASYFFQQCSRRFCFFPLLLFPQPQSLPAHKSSYILHMALPQPGVPCHSLAYPGLHLLPGLLPGVLFLCPHFHGQIKHCPVFFCTYLYRPAQPGTFRPIAVDGLQCPWPETQQAVLLPGPKGIPAAIKGNFQRQIPRLPHTVCLLQVIYKHLVRMGGKSLSPVVSSTGPGVPRSCRVSSHVYSAANVPWLLTAYVPCSVHTACKTSVQIQESPVFPQGIHIPVPDPDVQLSHWQIGAVVATFSHHLAGLPVYLPKIPCQGCPSGSGKGLRALDRIGICISGSGEESHV